MCGVADYGALAIMLTRIGYTGSAALFLAAAYRLAPHVRKLLFARQKIHAVKG